jgi:ribonucleoside-diphosphate reductase alpha chain
MGPHEGYEENAAPMLDVLRMHRDASYRIDEALAPAEILDAAQHSWEDAVDLGARHGVRNAQASVLAPTGTIGLLMDCDTTGIEPDLGLVKFKKLVGGGNMAIVNQTVPRALRKLGYSEDEMTAIVAYIDENKTIVGAPALKVEHLPVFACSMGDNTIHYLGHVKMMGAVQPFISGAISKTVNMPEDASIEDVANLHMDAWKLGVKAVAIYRDNCKVGQPLSTAKKDGDESTSSVTATDSVAAELFTRIEQLESELKVAKSEAQHVTIQAMRERMPRRRVSTTFAFRVADCEGYVTVGEYEDHRPGEVFIRVSKQGSTLAGIMDAFSISISLGLQHGVPLATYVRKYVSMKFEPSGMTDDADLRIATSLVDYIFRRLALDYLTRTDREELGVLSSSERIQPTLPEVAEQATPTMNVSVQPTLVDLSEQPPVQPTLLSRDQQRDAPMCYQCGNAMQRAGSCYVCSSCGATSGCS